MESNEFRPNKWQNEKNSVKITGDERWNGNFIINSYGNAATFNYPIHKFQSIRVIWFDIEFYFK